MATDDHLKYAATEISKASDAVKQEIDVLRNQDNEMQKAMATQLTALKSEMDVMNKQVDSAQDSHTQAQARTMLTNVQRQMDKRQDEMKREQKRIQDTIKEKEALMNSLDQQYRSVKP